MKVRYFFAVLLLLLSVAGCRDKIDPAPGPGPDKEHVTDTVSTPDPVPDEDPVTDTVITTDPPIDTVVTPVVVPVDSVILEISGLELLAGEADTLQVIVLPEDATDRSVIWSSSDSTVAEVSDGIITAVAAGSAVISATAGGESAECSVTVSRRGQKLNFAKPSMRLLAGSSEEYDFGKFLSMPQSADGAMTEVFYSSSDTSVAEISGNLIRINRPGTTTVTATAAQTDVYTADTASFTINIVRTDTFNLENPSVEAYLDEAYSRYLDRNYLSVSVVQQYCDHSESNRKDIPNPAMIYWDKTGPKVSATVLVYDSPEMDDEEVASVYTTADSAAVYNLIPGLTYYYTVLEGKSTVKTGSFTTTGRCRMMRVSKVYGYGHANNCRDLGGMKTEDGHTIKYGLLYRGTNIDAVTTLEKSFLVNDMNIGADIDLRDGTPTTGTVAGANGKGECNQPFDNPKYEVDYVYAGFGTIADLKVPSKIKKIFDGIINTVTEGRACYIHCAVGADRTGYICMLLEAALGVSFSDCTIDYELTSFSCADVRTRDGLVGGGFYTALRRYIANYSTGTFNENARKILRDAGITDAQMNALRRAVLE